MKQNKAKYVFASYPKESQPLSTLLHFFSIFFLLGV